MKYLSGKWCVVLLASVLLGCASKEVLIENHRNEFIARTISELKQEVKKPDSYASKIGWKERTYKLVNGNYVYVEPLYQDCSMDWEVNPEGTIVGGVPKGTGCEVGTKEPDDLAHTKISNE